MTKIKSQFNKNTDGKDLLCCTAARFCQGFIHWKSPKFS